MQADSTESQQSALQGQVAGLKLQLASAAAKVQELTQQLESESLGRQAAEQKQKHLWESQLLQQQQSVTHAQSHQQLLQKVQQHDDQQQKLLQQLQSLAQQNKHLSEKLRIRQQSLQERIDLAEQKLQGSDDTRKQLSEKLQASEQQRVQLEQRLLSNDAQPSQNHLQVQIQRLTADLDTAQHSVLQHQADLQHEVKENTALQQKLVSQQQLHEQQQQKLQQQLTQSQSEHQASTLLLQTKQDQLQKDVTLLQIQRQKIVSSSSALAAKLDQAEARCFRASAKEAEASARVDALILSEVSLHLQLGTAEERCARLVSEHAQVCLLLLHVRSTLHVYCDTSQAQVRTCLHSQNFGSSKSSQQLHNKFFPI